MARSLSLADGTNADDPFDLGAWWRRETGLPLALSGFAVRRTLGEPTARRLCR